MEDNTPDPAFALWDVHALAENTGLSLRMARTLISERRVPVVKVGKRMVRVRPSDVRRYLAENTIPAAQ